MASQKSTPSRPICWFEIPVKDTTRAREFYTELFGWTYQEFIDYESDYWTIDTGDGSLGGGFVKTPKEINSDGIILFIHVENIQKVIQHALRLGACIVEGESVITEDSGRHAKITDLDGNTIGLWTK
ncbi:VOC family protein [bacterium]|nr:VOC family protein [bacterium]